MAVAVVAGGALGATVAILGSRIAGRRSASPATPEVDPRGEQRLELLHRLQTAERAMNGTISGFTTTRRRLQKLADATAEVAASLRAAGVAGIVAAPPREDDAFSVPRGLSRSVTRTPPVVEWQALEPRV